ncbi:unnamed protein product [Closterium sp. Yama58-4]|nr:unnamed protein product [Closterium sp. Yama58-4]
MGTPAHRRVLQACCLLLAVFQAVHSAQPDSPLSTDDGANVTRRMALVGQVPRSAAPLAAPLGSGFWSVNKNQFVDAHGRVVRFSGLMWSGFESDVAVVQGLWVRSYQSHLDQMRKLGFNAIRLPFAGDALEPTCYPKSIDYGKNPDLQGLNSLQVMDKIIAAAGQRGMKVILDYHQHHLLLNLPTEGLWWDPTTPPRKWLQRWIMLAKRYRGNPTVIGADLLNEPHFNGNTAPFPSPYWDVEGKYENPPLNFRTATKIVAAAIQRVNPDWIIFLEGMHNDYWWGGNCRVLMKAPLKLNVPNKLAYTAHEYGPFVYFQKFFNKSVTPDFPRNLPKLYNHHWGFIQKKGYAPVWVGEFGSKLPPPDSELNRVERTVFFTLIKYMKALKVSWTFAFWGPLSKDTGGILNDDWYTVRQDKLDALKPIMYPNFA